MLQSIIPLPPPPRKVRAVPGTGALWFPRIFIMPHLLIGVGGLIYWLFLILWTVFGSKIPGEAYDFHITHSSKGGTYYNLKYDYQVVGQIRSGSASVSRSLYEQMKAEDAARPKVTVKYFALGPFHHADLGEKGPWGSLGFFALWLAFWNGILSVFVYVLWIKPLMVRQLYKIGEVASGTVTGKRMQRGKSYTYYAAYTFRDSTTGEQIASECQVSSSDLWNNIREGQPITVLYLPAKPKRSTVYEFGGYKVVAEDGLDR